MSEHETQPPNTQPGNPLVADHPSDTLANIRDYGHSQLRLLDGDNEADYGLVVALQLIISAAGTVG